MNFERLLAGGDAAALAAALDNLSEAERVAACMSLDAKQQQALWELASRAPRLEGRVIGRAGGNSSQRYAGRNSLALFSRFQKRFFDAESHIYGHNVHPLSPLIGPGYFGVGAGAEGRLVFDYRDLPRSVPAGWPPVRDNRGLAARPVYGDLVDEVVWLARDVLVGAAFRDGKPMNSYFVLARVAD